MSLQDTARKIIQLRWDKNYQQVLEAYRTEVHNRYSIEEITGHYRLMSAVADSLKETGKFVEMLKMIEDVWKLQPENIAELSFLRNLAWAYFFSYNPARKPAPDYKSSRTGFIISLLSKLSYPDDANLSGQLFFRYIDFLNEINPPRYSEVLLMLNTFGPDFFGETCRTIVLNLKGQEKEAELASDREKWFVMFTKVLYALEQYTDCIAACKNAFENVNRFHHGNQHWLARRLSLCYKQTGDNDRAIHELEKLLKKRSEWFIEKELAGLYYQTGKLHEALAVCMKGFMNQGYSEYKTALFELAGEIYKALEQPVEACEMYWLAALAREEQTWKIPESLKDALMHCKQRPEADAAGFYAQLRQKHTSKSANEAGDTVSKPDLYHGNGIITRILHPGSNGDGFITDEAGNGIYFRIGNCRLKPDEVTEQLRVGFVAKLTERNGRKVYNAVKVFGLSRDDAKNV